MSQSQKRYELEEQRRLQAAPLFAQGLPNAEVARRLGVSRPTATCILQVLVDGLAADALLPHHRRLSRSLMAIEADRAVPAMAGAGHHQLYQYLRAAAARLAPVDAFSVGFYAEGSGPAASAQVITDRDTGQSRGFVEMQTEDGARAGSGGRGGGRDRGRS